MLIFPMTGLPVHFASYKNGKTMSPFGSEMVCAMAQRTRDQSVSHPPGEREKITGEPKKETKKKWDLEHTIGRAQSVPTYLKGGVFLPH